MHPNRFFRETDLRIGIDIFECFNANLKEVLSNIQPKNFIKTRLTLPVYRVQIEYETEKGNINKSDKYMIMDNSNREDDYSDTWADIFVRDYCDEHHLKNYQIIDIIHICDAVLPIG